MKKNLKINLQNQHGFTLVELLVVISIIAVIAALTIPALSAVNKTKFINRTKAEMGLLQTAIQRYHDDKGFYPPSNPSNPMLSPLYYELLGTTINNNTYQTLDNSAVAINTASVSTAFGVGGFVNCNKPGASEEGPQAKNFLPDLKPNQFGTNSVSGVPVTLLLASIGGPDVNYNPLNQTTSPYSNPWRYVYPGTNNPNSYDLWVQIQISGKKYLICNWSSQVQVNNPLP